ncbi:M4 family metallopeptidase [Paeniglutamicibacter sp. MACA_103]|uniref:M4 family metallopeptidase n=1 Tax=Paeniglutamicibacter sp. MACA_103 TaxID=3377337 RepID=UPI0038965E17
MRKATHPPTAEPHPRHHAVPPYLLMSMAACDGAWEAPVGMRDFMARPSDRGGRESPSPGPEARTRIATRARRTLLLDQALLHGRATVPRDIGRLVGPAGRLTRTISDAQGVETTPGAVARTEGREPVEDEDANRAYAGLGAVHRFLVAMLGRNALDGAGLDLGGTVHYGLHYANAFWDGTQMVMGDGDGEIFGSFASSLSVIAHELGHGLLQFTTNLEYRGQSGALNESMADILGVLVEQFVAGQDAADASWLIGEGLFTDKVRGRAMRSLAAPGTAYDDPILGKDPQPATMAGYVDTEEDNGGVHLNSGIPNHAFYLFATALGGNAWETAGDLWFNVIATRALPEDADFGTFAEQTLLQARRDHGAGSDVELALAKAWDAVGVEPRVLDTAGQ